jgi:hypothetical protein
MNICNIEEYKYLIVVFVSQLSFMLIEYWLGKTDRTKSGSILELIINVMKLIITKSWRK